MQEQRDSARHGERGQVAVTVLSSPLAPDLELETFYCSIADVSDGGLGFDVHTKVPCGAVLKLKVQLLEPVEEFLHRGTVVRCADSWRDRVLSCRIGVRLAKGEERVRGAWAGAVRRRSVLIQDRRSD
jgi:hypothetical protein